MAFCVVEEIDRLVRRFAAGAHQDNDVLGIGRAVIFEESVTPSGELRETIHRLLHDRRTGSIKWIHRFARLKIDIRILGRAADDRMIG